jgi:hypothetical protein
MRELRGWGSCFFKKKFNYETGGARAGREIKYPQ